MDVEKLIERLRTESLYADKASLEIMDLCMDAAAALSTLQAENEKLRAEMKQERAHRLHAEKHADAFLEDCKRLNAELENYRKGHCSEGGCAAEKDRDLIIAENDRLRAELEQVKRDFGGICEYIDSEGFLRKQFCENGNPDLEPCICPSLQEHPGYIDSDDCEGCDHFCNSWCGQKED